MNATARSLAPSRPNTAPAPGLGEALPGSVPGDPGRPDARLADDPALPDLCARAAGPRKWDVDGNEYVDYFGGHGALLLGHCASGRGRGGAAAGHARHPLGRLARAGGALGRAGAAAGPVRRARPLHRLGNGSLASRAAARARLHRQAEDPALRRTLPRLARSGRRRRDVAFRRLGPGRAFRPSLVEQSIAAAGGRRLAGRRGDRERATTSPQSSSSHRARHGARCRCRPGFLRRACAKRRGARGVLLIIDEVITGFRWSRGGAQARYGVTPDLCVLAKIVAGGLPGGAVAGRKDVMDQLDPAAAKAAGRRRSVTRAPSTPTRCAPPPRSRR